LAPGLPLWTDMNCFLALVLAAILGERTA